MSAQKTLELFATGPKVINLGLPSFADDLRRSGAEVLHVDWRPPAGGDPHLLHALESLQGSDGGVLPEIATANEEAVSRLLAAKPMLVGLGKASELIEGMHAKHILHAGPPVSWQRMSGPTRGAVMGALVFEGLAETPEQAATLAASGEIEFSPCHHHQAVGPMAGVISASMSVWIVENTAFGNRAYCTLNEGLGKVLRYGAFGDEVMQRLRWMECVLAPALSQALTRAGSLDLRSLIAQALQMGDEGHNRNRAATSLVIRALAPHLIHVDLPKEEIEAVLRFIDSNDHFFLNLSMPACKAALDPCRGIKDSTMVVAMARNGTDFGVQLASMPDRWFTAPAPLVEGLYLPGFSAADAAPDIGDSVITETAGIGGFAMAAAPAIVQFVGGNASQALSFTRKMLDITLAEHSTYKIPALDFHGTPVGIDVMRVVESGVVPVVNTGIAHHEPGIGMVGAGLVKPPIACFEQALTAFCEHKEQSR
ncbi:MAG: DUF1116 domain-containing protein [Deltaproteobacteria bacterium]|nr:DUF1116 domain-containing protein [Deltaproteobacteria bacterium]